MKTMTTSLKDKRFCLYVVDENADKNYKLNIEDCVVAINGMQTELPATSLFTEITDKGKLSIRGYSFMQFGILLDGYIVMVSTDKLSFKVCLFDTVNKFTIGFIKVENPIVIMNDKLVHNEEMMAYYDKLKNEWRKIEELIEANKEPEPPDGQPIDQEDLIDQPEEPESEEPTAPDATEELMNMEDEANPPEEKIEIPALEE